MKPTRRQRKAARARCGEEGDAVAYLQPLPHDVAAKVRSLRKRGQRLFPSGIVIVMASDMAWELL